MNRSPLETVASGGAAPPVQAGPITHDPEHLFDNVIVQSRPGLYLRISRQNALMGCASLYVGAYHPRNRVLSTHFRLDTARVTHAPRKDRALMLGDTAFELPWFHLLKAADFLLLPIPVLPAGQATAVAP